MTGAFEIRQWAKTYGTVAALKPIDLDIRMGEVIGLIGQNGSGKTTLLKLLGGLETPTSGQIRIDGAPVELRSAAVAGQYGIGMVHQEQSLIPNLTVAENIFLGKPHPSKRNGLINWSSLELAASRQLEKLGVTLDTAMQVERLTFAQRQQVELAKALALEDIVTRPPLILLDEPTSVLAPDEIQRLFGQVRRLRDRAAFVFVSHRLDEVLTISDRIIVMTDGRMVAELRPRDVDRARLYELMVGHERNVAPARARQSLDGQQCVLELRKLSGGRHFKNVDLSVRRGEIVGIAGVASSGAEELCRAIFGIEAVSSGQVFIDKAEVTVQGPVAAIGRGIGYISADRRSESMLVGRSLVQNMVLTFGSDHSGSWVRRKVERAAAVGWMKRLKVKMPSPDCAIETLSGGNQQKVVLGKWFMGRKLKILLLDHPSRGLDPGARDDLFEAIRSQAADGLAVLIVGDTVSELLELSDRIVVMRDGLITAVHDLAEGDAPAEQDVVKAMV